MRAKQSHCLPKTSSQESLSVMSAILSIKQIAKASWDSKGEKEILVLSEKWGDIELSR